ncbi:MAG: NADP-dependent oxidoreductase [Pseudomonadota bacterium]|nr:NADP-dependent oxidoreductase [Pseudomonadota bacterium]
MIQRRKIVLKRRPDGIPAPDDFELIHEPLPSPRKGEFLIAHDYIGLSPAARIRMDDRESYAPPLALGEVIYGGIAGHVIASDHPEYSVGDTVTAVGGWQSHSISDGRGVERWDMATGTLPNALGLYGFSGNTAYAGLLGVARIVAGDTVVVSAASGAVGSAACQIARILGCRVVGIAGSAEKCAYVRDVLGADACIDRNAPDFDAQLATACPDGIDVNFENVGGKTRDAVLQHMNRFGRVVVCGLIAEYNALGASTGPSWFRILHQRLRVEGFLLSDYRHLRADFLRDMKRWHDAGQITYREDIRDGLETTPAVFADMLSGRNFGKTIIRV